MSSLVVCFWFADHRLTGPGCWWFFFERLAVRIVSPLGATANAAESQALAVAGGQADIVNVVTAIAAAETQLQTVIAVRDQVISAYQEILRMPI